MSVPTGDRFPADLFIPVPDSLRAPWEFRSGVCPEPERMPWEPGWGDLPHPPTRWEVLALEAPPLRPYPLLLVHRLRELGFIYPVSPEELHGGGRPGWGGRGSSGMG